MWTLQYLLFDFGRDSYASEESNQEKLMDGNAFHKPEYCTLPSIEGP